MTRTKCALLEGKAALITGAASGIGRAAAILFAREGAKVIASDRDRNGGEETVAMVRKTGADAVFIPADLTSPNDCGTLIAGAAHAWGGLDCAFNNAGTEGVTRSITELEEQDWDRVIATNLTAVWRCMKLEIPHLRARGGGAIVNCASIAGLVGFANATAYTASKHGVIGLTRAAALELAKTGIRINALCPGVIHTPMIDRVTHHDAAAEALYAGAEPMGRLGTAEEVAEAAAWLCSPRASFVTGAAIAVDGGWVAQ